MIRFKKEFVNNVVVTLYENSTVEHPIYLFSFTNQQTNVSYYFIAADTSQYVTRYNRFAVTEMTDADTLDGEVSLGNEGFYNYTIYETTLENTDGLTTANDAIPYILKVVEGGLVWVELADHEVITYTPESNETIVYNGG